MKASGPSRRSQKNMKVISPRQKMLRYDVDHFHDDFLIVTNKDGAKTNKLCSVAVEGASGAMRSGRT